MWQLGPIGPLHLCFARPRELQPGDIPYLHPCIPQGMHRGASHHAVVIEAPGAVSRCRHLGERRRRYFGVGAAGGVALRASGLQNPTVEEASSPAPVSPSLWGVFLALGLDLAAR